jgi:hypothetical protein
MGGLDRVNLTELIELAREDGLGNLDRNRSREGVYELLDDERDVAPEDGCALEGHRTIMEDHIQEHFRRLRTQLPGCNGKCRSFGCPDLIVVRCWHGFRDNIV